MQRTNCINKHNFKDYLQELLVKLYVMEHVNLIDQYRLTDCFISSSFVINNALSIIVSNNHLEILKYY